MLRSTKQAPDLIGAGNKYQRAWLVSWLENPNEKLYPVGYDFNVKRKGRHLSLSSHEAKKVADFLSTLKDSRITQGTMKNGTQEELARGEQLYREHSCQNCHWTPAKNRLAIPAELPARPWSTWGIVFRPIGSIDSI